MTKNDLAIALTKQTGLTKSQALRCIDALAETVITSLGFGHDIFLRGFGSFKIEQRKAHKARDISRGTTVIVPAHKVVKFLPSKQLKDVVK